MRPEGSQAGASPRRGPAFCSYASGVVIETAPRQADLAAPSDASDLQRALDAGWITPGQHVLDLGCGLGAELAYLAEHGVHACGIDASAASLVHPSAVQVLQADVLHLPFADETFDVLLDRGCFGYVPTAARNAYVGELRRVLRPDGQLLLWPDVAPVSRAALSDLRRA